MLVARFDPFRPIRDMEKSFYNYPSNEAVSGFVPTVNTREGESAFHIDVDLPGIKKDDIKVDIDKDVLTISGERKTKDELKEEDYYRIETSFGKFSRSFTLPENIDLEHIEARSDNGVLEVILPKMAEVQNRKSIDIK